MLAVCNLTKEVDSKRAAELMMARFYSHRNITWVHAKVKDISFSKLDIDSEKFTLNADFLVRRIKANIDINEKQHMNGLQELPICPNIYMLIYLANHRQVMVAGDIVDCILQNNFTVKVCVKSRTFGIFRTVLTYLQEEFQNDALFTKTGSNKSITAKSFSKDLQGLGKKAKIEFTVTPRGCRAGFACQAFMSSIYYHGRICDETINDVKKQAFWKDDAWKAYERFCLDQLMDTANSQIIGNMTSNDISERKKKIMKEKGYISPMPDGIMKVTLSLLKSREKLEPYLFLLSTKKPWTLNREYNIRKKAQIATFVKAWYIDSLPDSHDMKQKYLEEKKMKKKFQTQLEVDNDMSISNYFLKFILIFQYQKIKFIHGKVM